MPARPFGAACSLTYQYVLELEGLFENHGVCSAAILVLERMLHERRALVHPLPSSLQLANRQKEAHFLTDLVVAYTFPPHISGFVLPIFDLTQVWSGSDSEVIEPDDILALAAAVFMFIKNSLSPITNWSQQSQSHLPGSNLMTSQFFKMRAQFSRSPVSNSGCWQPSHQWDVLTFRRSFPEQLPHSASSCCSFRIPRRLR